VWHICFRKLFVNHISTENKFRKTTIDKIILMRKNAAYSFFKKPFSVYLYSLGTGKQETIGKDGGNSSTDIAIWQNTF